MNRLTVALVGAGRMGDLRAPILYANPRVDLVCVVEYDEVKGEALAMKYNCKYYKTLTEAKVEMNDINAIVLCTPTFTHVAAIEEASSLGLHIFTEKPVAEDAKDIQKIYKVCREHKVNLCCGFQRRFDKSYIALRDSVVSGRIGTPKMIHIFFADHPPPPIEFLKHSGDPFMDLSVHDIDFIRWVLNEAEPLEVMGTGSSSNAELESFGVLDNATMYIKFQGGATCNLMMSRGSTYGYDQRCEIYGDKGIASITSSNESSLKVGDEEGIHRSPLQYSFPQCFREAFESEIATFISTLLDGQPWPISEKDCVMAQLIATAAKSSCQLGRTITFRSVFTADAVTLRPIGNGNFAKHMLGLLSGNDNLTQLFEVFPPYSPSSGLSYDGDVLDDSKVQAVYVCSPDSMHHTHAAECLQKGKHVLVEKPVYEFSNLLKIYEHLVADRISKSCPQRVPVLMVGFHRRFDNEFIRAKQACYLDLPRYIVIESRDPVPAETDLPFVLKNSMCHDVDLVHWLLGRVDDRTVSIEFTSCNTDKRISLIEFSGLVTVQSRKEDQTINLKLQYCKESLSYVQKCILDGVIFGYDFEPPKGSANPYDIYQNAYISQWECFAGLIRDDKGINQDDRERERWESYRDTFDSLNKAEKLLIQAIST